MGRGRRSLFVIGENRSIGIVRVEGDARGGTGVMRAGREYREGWRDGNWKDEGRHGREWVARNK